MNKQETKLFLRSFSVGTKGRSKSEGYPFNIPAIRRIRNFTFRSNVTILIGENGSGKSTLLEAIAVSWGFNPEGGTINFRFSTRDSHSQLSESLRLVRSDTRPRDGFFLRAESFFNLGTDIERLDAEPSFGPPIINSYGGKSLHEQSHGESFLALLLNRFGGNGFYVLDEPEAALSPTRQLAMLRRIYDLVSNNSQFIIATHSPILMAYPGALLYEVSEKGLKEIAYHDTEHFQVTRKFLMDPAATLKHLLAED